MAKIISPLTGTLQSIKSQFIGKEKIIKSTLNIQKKRITLRRFNAERERFINYENVLERPLNSLGKGVKNIKSAVSKKLGFLDAVKTFIVKVLLGFIALKLLDYLPQLIQFATGALKVGNFIINTAGNVLNALVTFVDYGYKAYDHARKIVGKVGGEKAVASLDKATSETTKVMNQLFIAAMLFSDFSPFSGLGSAPATFNKSVDAIRDKVSGEVADAAADVATKTAGKQALGPLASAGIIIGAGLLFSAAGEGVFQLTNWAKSLMGFGPIAQFFKVPLGILEGVGTLFDILGAPFRYGIELIRAGFMKMFNMKDGLEKQAKNLGKFDARIRENFRRLSGIFAPVFSFFGQEDTAKKLSTPGSFGSLYGEKAVKDMGYSGGGRVISIQKYARGGSVVDIPRTEVKEVDIERTEVKKQKLVKSGSLVGGTSGFLKVFPDTDDEDRMDRYTYMTSSYSTISSIPDLGNVMSLTVKSLLGDQVIKEDYDGAASSLSSLMMRGVYEQNPYAYGRLSSLIKMKEFNMALAGFLMKSMSDPFGAIVGLLRSQVGLAPLPGYTTQSEGNVCAAACDTGTSGGMAVSGDAVDKAILDLISSVEAKDYDTMNVSRGATPGKPTQMTVDWLVANARGAIGRYQQMPQYLLERVIAAGGKGSDKFTPELQDRTALKMLYSGHGFSRWRSGQMSDEEFGNRLSATWRGLPHSSGGTYPDQFAGRNKAHMSRPAFMTRLAQIKAGGMGTMAKIAPGSPAANVDPCICDPEVPDGDPGDIQAAGSTVGQKISGYPITSGFGPRTHPVSGERNKQHGGVDISGMRQGAPYALNVPGVAGPPPQYEGGYGNFIDIKIPSLDLYFRFAHMVKPPNYKPGQDIPAGKIFGNAGTTGSSTGVHLHFEVNKRISGYGGDRDPTPYGKYISIGKETGGSTLLGGIRLLHKGEYVIDKDSVDLFGGNVFFSMINAVENEKQRSEKASQLIKHLETYTGRKIDQRPEMIVQNSEPIINQLPPTYIPSGSSMSSSGDSGPNWEQDRLELRA